ncbi:hypothetical protein MMC16_003020 [Acarospora aff. strigata]|nr:hypothetical protein [Acarospora aff. strigata]
MPPSDNIDPSHGSGTFTATEAAFLSECLKHTEGTVIVKIDAVAQACGHNDTKSAADKLHYLRKKFGLKIIATNTKPGEKYALDATAITTGGPANPAANKVTKWATSATKKGTARIVKKPKGANVKSVEVKDDNEEDADAEDIDHYSLSSSHPSDDLGSTTEEDEIKVPTDANGKIFPNINLREAEKDGITCSHLMAATGGMIRGNMSEVLAHQKNEDEAAKVAAAETLLTAAGCVPK